MEYVHAALLLHAAKKEINEQNVISVLSAAGIQPDQAKAKALVAALQGVNIDEAIKQAALPVAAAPAPAAPAGGAKKEEKKEEKKPTEEVAAEGLSALFG